jgi:hypothetical protein
MTLIPARFLLRLTHPCRYHKAMPRRKGDDLFTLPAECRVATFAEMDGGRDLADIRLAWNVEGLGVSVEVWGKSKPVVGTLNRPRGSDGLTLWIDTRDSRKSHRASRYCHQFHFLATGGGPDLDEATVIPARIHRALEDAPLASPANIPLVVATRADGYTMQAFLPAAALTGFDPLEHPRWGFFYAWRDDELGEQLLSLTPEFPYWEDPSLWSTLELMPAK